MNKWIKLLVVFTSILIFTLLFFIIIYYYNIFVKNKNNHIGTNQNINITTDNIKNNNIIKKNSNDLNKKNITTKQIKILKEKMKKIEIKKSNIKILDNSNKKLINQKLSQKIRYLIEDKNSLYFIIKFLNKSFFIFKMWNNIYYVDLWKDNANINIRKDYKEKINSIYDKSNLIKFNILKNIKILNKPDKINDLSFNTKSFLSWFLSTTDNYELYWSEIINRLNIKPWYHYPLYWKVNISFNINKIIFINNLFNKNNDLWQNLIDSINNNYNNLLFINFTKKEISYIINFFFKRILIKKDDSFYNLYKIKVTNYNDFILYLFLKKITYYIAHSKNKNTKKIITSLKKDNKLIRSLFIAYYRSIKKYKQIDPYIIQEVFFEGTEEKVLPIQKNKVIDQIIWNINNLIIIK